MATWFGVFVHDVISDEQFIQAFDSTTQPVINNILSLHEQISNGTVSMNGLSSRKSPKNINFYFTFRSNEKTALTITIGVNGGIAGKTLDFWCNNPNRQQQVLSAIESDLNLQAKPLPAGSNYGIVAKWELSQVDIAKLIEFFKRMSELS